MKRALTYRRAGVDVGAAGRFIRALQPLAGQTRGPGWVGGIGGFGGLFRATGLLPNDPILVASADGVGTKLLLARRVGRVRPLGVDLVAMNVNDVLCTGARPLFFLDYIASGKLDPALLLGIVRGIVAGCRQAGCLLLGGETAQMGLLYRPGDFDLAGFAVGAVGAKALITGERIRAGDRLLGLASSGPHANGFTLVQKALSPSSQRRFATALLQPTRIYVRPVLELLRRQVPVHGIAHITGGSFREKLVRILPGSARAVLWKGSWPVPPIFRTIQAAGVTEDEMYRTFNMGIGMVLVLPARAAGSAQKILKAHGVASWVVGEVVRGGRGLEMAR